MSDSMDFARRLSAEIADLRKQVKTLQSVSMLTHASIDDGALRVRDREGRIKQVIGKQPDGSFGDEVVESGPQPQPTAPVTEVATGLVQAGWDGGVTSGRVPTAFGRVRLWGAPGTSPGVSEARHLGSLHERSGGAVTVKLDGGPWRLWWVMVGADGKTVGPFSEPSDVVIEPLVDAGDIEARIQALTDGELDDAVYDSLMARSAAFIALEAGQIISNSWAGTVATAPLVQSHDAPETGWKLDPASGFRMWNGGGGLTARIDGESNFLRGDLMAESIDLQGALRVGSSSEGGIVPTGEGRIRIEGRMPDDAGAYDQFVAGTTPYFEPPTTMHDAWVTYAEPAPTGNRLPVVSTNLASGWGDPAGLVAVSSMSRQAAQFRYWMQPLFSGDDPPRTAVTYLATWGQSL
ncbi:hypothetical protein [Nesterenkonia suensis]